MPAKEDFCELLCNNDFERIEGLKKMYTYLESTDFFVAPSSTIYHSAFPGGLLCHSLNVLQLLKEKVERYTLPYSEESVTIVSLLHDICKANFYVKDKQEPSQAQMKYLQDLCKGTWPSITAQGFLSRTYVAAMISWLVKGRVSDQPVYGHSYIVEDQLPIGHGEKSLYLIAPFIELANDEAAAIRWHMIAFDAGIHFNYPSGFPFREAIKRYPLVTLLFTADFEASNILEV